MRGKDFVQIGSDFVQIGSGPFDIDLVFAPEGIELFDAALRDAERVEDFPLMALSDLLASRRAAGDYCFAFCGWID